MKKSIPNATLAIALLFGISALTADKVAVVPLGSGAQGTDGQLQYNDNGRTAGILAIVSTKPMREVSAPLMG
jgi:hypothetical protein